MSIEKTAIDIGELLAGNEEIISQHYQIYADIFKDFKEFWSSISKEELNHAQLIRELNAEARKGRVSINEKRFDYQSVKEFQKHLKDMLTYLRQNEVSIKQALQDGLAIEKIMLEKNFFEVFETNVLELKEKINTINEDVKRHRKSIEDLLEKNL